MTSRGSLRPLVMLLALVLTADATGHAAWSVQAAPDAQITAFVRKLREARHGGRTREVLANISAAPAGVRGDARVLGEQIQALLDAGRHAEARDLAATVAPSDAGYPPPLGVALVRLQFARGDVANARKNSELLRAQLPQNVDLMALRVRLLIVDGDHAAAEELLTACADDLSPAVVLDARVALALSRASEFMADDALLGRAVPLLHETLALAPARADVRALLGRALARWQRFEEAESVLAEGLTTAEGAERAELLYARGFLARARQDDAGAVAAFEQVLALDENHPMGLLGLARTKADRGDVDGARALLERCLAADPSHVDALLVLAEVESDAGRLEAAEDALRRVLAGKPQHLKALWQLSRLAARQGRTEDVDDLVARYEARRKALLDES